MKSSHSPLLASTIDITLYFGLAGLPEIGCRFALLHLCAFPKWLSLNDPYYGSSSARG